MMLSAAVLFTLIFAIARQLSEQNHLIKNDNLRHAQEERKFKKLMQDQENQREYLRRMREKDILEEKQRRAAPSSRGSSPSSRGSSPSSRGSSRSSRESQF